MWALNAAFKNINKEVRAQAIWKNNKIVVTTTKLVVSDFV